MLRRIEIDNFRPLRDFSADLDGDLTLFTGENGTGKSSVLAALQQLLLQRSPLPPAWNAGVGRQREPQTIAVNLELDEGDARYELQLRSEPGGLEARVVHECVTVRGRVALEAESDGDELLVTLAPSSSERKRVHLSADRPALFALGAGSGDIAVVRAALEGIVVLSITPDEVSSEKLTRWPGLNFIEWLRGLEHAARERIFAQLREVLCGFRTIRFDGVGEPPSPRAIFEFEGREEAIPFAYLSEGQRMLCALYAASEVLLDANVALFIDEPENFISSRELQPWLRSIEQRLTDVESAGGRAQVVIVSHHPELLDQLARANGIWFERLRDGRIVTKRWADAYPNLNPSEVVARGWVSDSGE